MKLPRAQFNLGFVLIASATLLFSACSDDDDGMSPPEGTTFPLTMNFHDITDTELLLWIGGEPVSTEGLQPGDLLTDDDLFAMTETYHENQSITFTSDSAFFPDFAGANAYFFENDSLFGTVLFDGVPVDVFIAEGDFSELRLSQNAYRYCHGGSSSTTCGWGGGNTRTSFESIVANEDDLSADDFGPEDSLAVYNITMRFRP